MITKGQVLTADALNGIAKDAVKTALNSPNASLQMFYGFNPQSHTVDVVSVDGAQRQYVSGGYVVLKSGVMVKINEVYLATSSQLWIVCNDNSASYSLTAPNNTYGQYGVQIASNGVQMWRGDVSFFQDNKSDTINVTNLGSGSSAHVIDPMTSQTSPHTIPVKSIVAGSDNVTVTDDASSVSISVTPPYVPDVSGVTSKTPSKATTTDATQFETMRLVTNLVFQVSEFPDTGYQFISGVLAQSRQIYIENGLIKGIASDVDQIIWGNVV